VGVVSDPFLLIFDEFIRTGLCAMVCEDFSDRLSCCSERKTASRGDNMHLNETVYSRRETVHGAEVSLLDECVSWVSDLG
jgi:hypothetical protein